MNILKIAVPTPMLKSVPKTYSAVILNENLNAATLAAIGVSQNDAHQLQVANQLCQQSHLQLPIVCLSGDLKQDQAKLLAAATQYQAKHVPGFLSDLITFANERPISFTTPGHHNGRYYDLHPAGVTFKEFFGDNMLYADTSDTVAYLGDTMTHQGTPLTAQQKAAEVYHADKVYFCTNGTTSANTICASALLTAGDVVLFDRNNHKSLYNSALLMHQALPVYLPTDRNAYGMIGEVLPQYLDETYLRQQVAKVNPKKAQAKRPFRLAVLQLETYDGLFYQAKWLLEKLGHLCDYILFDCAWGGYEQFVGLMQDLSPLQLSYTAEDPGILVTQSIHKQQAGMGQASQILKKDAHLKGQARYVDHKHFNHAYLKYVTSSYAYPLYASLTVNSYLAGSQANIQAWEELLKLSIEFRKELFRKSKLFKPFVPPTIDGVAWQDIPTEQLASEPKYWQFEPEETWHGFKQIATGQAMVDPFKLTICLPGIEMLEQSYQETGICGQIVAQYLSEHQILHAKADFNSLLFLLTPGDTPSDLAKLLEALLAFERAYLENATLTAALPKLASQHPKRYEGYSLPQLCHEMHAYYAKNHTFELQQQLFAKTNLQDYFMTPFAADEAFMQSKSELCPLDKIEGRVALEGALPYPPGVFVVAPGERWSKTAQQYFSVLAGAIARFDGFVPEIQGVYYHVKDQKITVEAEVLTSKFEKI